MTQEVISYPVGLCLHPCCYQYHGASRVVSEDPTCNYKLLWFPAYSSHVYVSVTTNSVVHTTLEGEALLYLFKWRSRLSYINKALPRTQLGVYISVNWNVHSIFEKFHAYSEVIIDKFTHIHGIPCLLEEMVYSG